MMEQKTEITETALQSYLNHCDHDLLTAEEEVELYHRIQAGDLAARNKLITSNLRLVVALARKHVGRGVELEDLIEEGNLGLFRAVEKFDATKGWRFTTYAIWWIRQNIQRAIKNQSSVVRVPLHTRNEIISLNKVKGRLENELGRAPTREELLNEVDLDANKVDFLEKQTMEMLHVDELEYEPDFLGEPDGSANQCNKAEIQKIIDEELGRLKPMDAMVMRLRFGLGCETHTLDAAGEIVGRTRERIRQIECKVLRVLRARFMEAGVGLDELTELVN